MSENGDGAHESTDTGVLMRFGGAQTISESLASLTALLDNVPGMVAYWDTDLRNRFANRAYIDWFGVDPVALTGTHIRDLLGPTVFELNEPYMRRALAGEQQHFERTLVDPNGTTRYSQAVYTPHSVDGAIIGFFVLVTDVSPLKRSQQDLADRNAQLAAEIATRELLMATLTHDLRAPLSAVIGYAELLTEEMPDLSSDEQTAYVDVINRNSHELLAMVDQLVEFGKNEIGAAQFTLEPIDVDATVEAVVVSLTPRAQAKGLSLTAAASSEGLRIHTDHHAFQRVLTNLIVNAIKFTDEGNVTVRTTVTDGRGCIAVADTGSGISIDDQQVIFQAFQRGTASESRKREGLGLGLHICAQLTELTGGDISVSSVGHGSTFTVSWPLASEV